MKNTTLKLFCSYILILLFMIICGSAKGQNPCGNDEVCVVEFNASWNDANKVEWIEELTDCKVKRILIDKGDWQKKYSIVVTPTIIIFNGEDEAKRFQANIMMKMEATLEDVQNSIDEVIMEGF